MDLPLRALIQQAEFKDSFRGYDRNQVDDLLERVADRVGELESALADAEAGVPRPDAATDAATSAEIERQVQERVQADLAQRPPGAPAAPSAEDDASEALRRTLVLAQRTADAAIAEAREEAERLLAEARQEAEGVTAEARADADQRRAEAREHLVVEITELEAIRETLRGDVALLEHHVGSQRDEVRQALARLQELLDDPVSFRVEPAPPVTSVTLPAGPPTDEPAEPGEAADAAQPAPEAVAEAAEAEPPLDQELEPILEGDAILEDDAGLEDATVVIDVTGATEGEVAEVGNQQNAEPPPADEPADQDDDDIPWPSVLAGSEPPGGPAAPPPLVFDAETAVDHEEPGAFGGRFDDVTAEDGPLTEAVEPIDARSEEDAFLAELRRAVADEAMADAPPTEAVPPVAAGQEASLFDQDQADDIDGRPRSRFGRRR